MSAPSPALGVKPGLLAELVGVSRVHRSGEAAVRAIDGVDLKIDRGDFVAIVGASGSGKSTCLNIIGCLDVPTTGVYRLKGLDVGAIDASERAILRRDSVGFIFQGFHLLSRTSALENVEMPLVYRGAPRRRRRDLAAAALDAVGLGHRLDHTPEALSGGQQQRVAIARAIVCNPDMLIADEPTGSLDSVTRGEVIELLEVLNRTFGMTVVMVTHDAVVADRARRIIRFQDGRIIARDGEGIDHDAA